MKIGIRRSKAALHDALQSLYDLIIASMLTAYERNIALFFFQTGLLSIWRSMVTTIFFQNSVFL